MKNKMNKIAIVIPGIKKTGGPESLHNLAFNLQKEFNMSILFITHDLNIVQKFSDDVCVMKEGEIIEAGSVNDIFTNPSHAYTKKLLDIVDEYHEIKLDSSGINPVKDLYLIHQIYRILKKVKPATILNFTIKPVIYGTFAAQLLGNIAVINTITGLGTAFISKGLTNKIAKFLYKFTFKYSYLVFFQNPDDKQLFKELNIISKDNTKLVSGSGVDLLKFYPSNNKKTDKIKILFIGRIDFVP